MKVEITKTQTITETKEVPLRFFEIGDRDFREVVAATDLLSAIKTAAEESGVGTFTDFLENCKEELIIKELTLKQIEKTKIWDPDTNKRISVKSIIEEGVKNNETSFIIYSIGD
jgi:hypothetical protein